MPAYYTFIKREQQENGISVAHYQPTKHAQGAWNEHEQHMAPATGVLTAELNGYAPQHNMRIARISLDILGLIPLDDFTITTRCIRPGKTIELIEAVMSSRGRDAIIARAWRLMTQDTSEIAGIEDQQSAHKPEDLSAWDGMKGWPGGFIESVRLVTDTQRRPGRGMIWITNDFEMVEGVPTDDLVHLLGMVDTANGVVPRVGLGLSKLEWMFPNTDLQIHMHRKPQGRWLGIEAVQQYGDDGIGLTSGILHDTQGPFGRSEQILTIRPMPR
ncbi:MULTISPECIES: thioesterase family protein [Psychrobacter]|uniref:TesB-like acyl-CoA thioesterase 5 n=1 Tax=Psychrobacter alimentarius TaxID=261164 RepID=A0ABN4N8N1_9GAMM|nr:MULTISPECIES: thioesterase family protein [Psychrobacter]AMT97804.1 TesB-like acyl-CoA thioesterase 5 [Psychrobacter alimentarius]QCB29916.1 thioesterase family protein [Psychrobacter sp. PAMC27889]